MLTNGPFAIPAMLPKLQIQGLVVDTNVIVPVDCSETRAVTSGGKSRPDTPAGWTPTELLDGGVVGLLVIKADVRATPDDSGELRVRVRFYLTLAQGA